MTFLGENRTFEGMKRILPLFLMVALVLFSAFDWKAQPNDELRARALQVADSIAHVHPGTPMAKMVNKFIRDQKREKDPYAWIGQTHQLVHQLKKMYPPAFENAAIRQSFLQLLDYPLHVNNLDPDIETAHLEAFTNATQTYITDAWEQVLNALDTTYPEQGLVIWKIYNMGFILRTAHHTLAIDITRGASTANYQRLARHIDALFVTHPHSDHYTAPLVQAMLDLHKPVVSPIVLPGTQDTGSYVLMDDKNEVPQIIAGMEVLHFSGNQGEDIPCNIYLIEMDAIRIAHNGDNYDHLQEDKLAEYPAADLLLASTWNNIQDFVTAARKAPGSGRLFYTGSLMEARAGGLGQGHAGAEARSGAQAGPLLIPAHENEMGHGVRNRESYWELYTRSDRMGSPDYDYPPFLVVDNGEGLFFSVL